MTLLLIKLISMILKALKSSSAPLNVALGFAVGFLAGITPFNWAGLGLTLIIFVVFDIAGFLGAA